MVKKKNKKGVKHFLRNGYYVCNPNIEVVKEKCVRVKDKVTCKNCLKVLRSEKK